MPWGDTAAAEAEFLRQVAAVVAAREAQVSALSEDLAVHRGFGTCGVELDVAELTELLTAAKLLKHAAAIEKAGYAEPDDLRAAEDEELLEVGIRKPEIKRLRKYLSDAANLKRRQTCRGTRTRRASRRSKRSRTS